MAVPTIATPLHRSIPGASLLLATYERTPESTPHSHAAPLASFLLDGVCDEIGERGDRRRLMAGGFHLTPIDMRHRHVQVSPRGTALCVAFGEEFQSLDVGGGSPLRRPILSHAASLRSIAGRLADEIGGTDAASSLIVQGLLIEVVGILGRERTLEEQRTPRWLLRAAELLREPEALERGILGVANLVAVHPSHLTRTFKAQFGMTPGEYARRARLEKCRGDVQRGDLPLQAIAEAAGFADPAHFSREFKRAFGMTPSAYRRAA